MPVSEGVRLEVDRNSPRDGNGKWDGVPGPFGEATSCDWEQ